LTNFVFAVFPRLTAINGRTIYIIGLLDRVDEAFCSRNAVQARRHLNWNEMMSDSSTNNIDSATLLDLTARIVSAYAGNATLSPAELTEMIGSVSRALSQLTTTSVEPEVKELTPAVSVKKSVTADFIVCLEDGKKLKMLKRHLMSTYGMTPAEYRTRWWPRIMPPRGRSWPRRSVLASRRPNRRCRPSRRRGGDVRARQRDFSLIV
jgi:predicted transcriptional regulator